MSRCFIGRNNVNFRLGRQKTAILWEVFLIAYVDLKRFTISVAMRHKQLINSQRGQE